MYLYQTHNDVLPVAQLFCERVSPQVERLEALHQGQYLDGGLEVGQLVLGDVEALQPVQLVQRGQVDHLVVGGVEDFQPDGEADARPGVEDDVLVRLQVLVVNVQLWKTQKHVCRPNVTSAAMTASFERLNLV